MQKSYSFLFFLLSQALVEGLMGIPFFGAALIVSSGYWLLFMMIFSHLYSLRSAKRRGRPLYPHIIGLAANVLGWIPLVGMTLHIIAAVCLLHRAWKEARL